MFLSVWLFLNTLVEVGWISMIVTLSRLSQCEPCKAEKQKGPNCLHILESFSRAACINLHAETVLNTHAASGSTISGCILQYNVNTLFPRWHLWYKRLAKCQGKLVSLVFLFSYCTETFWESAMMCRYLCKLTIYTSAFIAWNKSLSTCRNWNLVNLCICLLFCSRPGLGEPSRYCFLQPGSSSQGLLCTTLFSQQLWFQRRSVAASN